MGMFRAHVFIVRRAKIVLYTLWYYHTYRWPSRAQIDDEHMCLKHVEALNKLIIKFSASSWLILRNLYNEFRYTWAMI
jgi:hypothetical protein